MQKTHPSVGRKAARVIAIGVALKLAIGLVAYALLADLHQLALAPL
jgi:hypothetical protein